ncbi:unnamed protein product [Gongylonema pulchrum]|uniref:Uncharacterized protein n=1 Tax=Gongylonema pulchrum TaxID=637853 RepID=A0A183DN30_9BILA|nr:unnamed protein product [Gongylonema pulchrum]
MPRRRLLLRGVPTIIDDLSGNANQHPKMNLQKGSMLSDEAKKELKELWQPLEDELQRLSNAQASNPAEEEKAGEEMQDQINEVYFCYRSSIL